MPSPSRATASRLPKAIASSQRQSECDRVVGVLGKLRCEIEIGSARRWLAIIGYQTIGPGDGLEVQSECQGRDRLSGRACDCGGAALGPTVQSKAIS